MNFSVKFAENSQNIKANLTESGSGFFADFGETGQRPFAVKFAASDQGFGARFTEDKQEFTTHFGEVVNRGYFPLYEGAYEVTPRIVAQTLETANKSMTSNVTICAIPYYEVDNNHKGQTVIIGGN